VVADFEEKKNVPLVRVIFVQDIKKFYKVSRKHVVLSASVCLSWLPLGCRELSETGNVKLSIEVHNKPHT
jgi:hypothetical protein